MSAKQERLSCPWCGARDNQWCADYAGNSRQSHRVRRIYMALRRFIDQFIQQPHGDSRNA